MFGRNSRMTWSRILLLKSKINLFRTYLTVPWCPRPKYADLLNQINQ